MVSDRSVYAAFCNPAKFHEICGSDGFSGSFANSVSSFNSSFSTDDASACNYTNSFVPDEEFDEWFLDSNVFCQIDSLGMSK